MQINVPRILALVVIAAVIAGMTNLYADAGPIERMARKAVCDKHDSTPCRERLGRIARTPFFHDYEFKDGRPHRQRPLRPFVLPRRRTHLQHRSPVSSSGWWDADASAYVKIALAAAALAILIWEQRRGRRAGAGAGAGTATTGATPRSEKLLRVLGVLGVLAYFNFGSFHFDGITVHLWDGLHHHLGAKYVDELGYDGLYDCIAVADAEQPGGAARAARRVMTDLRTNQMTTGADVVAHPERCRGRFSPARWQAFTADVAFFRSHFPDADWQRLTGDHGFNASPVWVLVARPLVGDAPVTDRRLELLAALDPLLMLAALAAVAWAFGLRGAALVAIVWGTYFPARLWWTGGSLLRWDWLAALLAGVAFARRGRPHAAGALLAYAALSRLFPVFALVGVALAALVALVRRQALDRALVRLLLGAAVTAALLVPLAGAMRPEHGWREFAGNVRKHTSVASPNRMGLAVVVAFNPATRQGQLARRGDDDVRGRWERAQDETLRARRPLWLVLAALGVVAIALATREQPAWAACVLGLLLAAAGAAPRLLLLRLRRAAAAARRAARRGRRHHRRARARLRARRPPGGLRNGRTVRGAVAAGGAGAAVHRQLFRGTRARRLSPAATPSQAPPRPPTTGPAPSPLPP